MWSGYEGPHWRRFADVLAGYGVQVIRSWVVNGKIFLRCREKGIGLNWGLKRTADDAQELANETVARAVVAFREKVLIPRCWTPEKGASLKTFFVGQCVFQFPNVYRAWEVETYPEKIRRREWLAVAPQARIREGWEMGRTSFAEQARNRSRGRRRDARSKARGRA
jgi:hypothetical protein